MRYRPLLLVASLVALHSVPALATPNFPTAIQSNLMLVSAPPCTLCHLTDQGGQGTVKTPFGMNMIARGLLPFDTASLDNALMLMADNGVISAGGCRSDIEELVAGSDPNHPADAGHCPDAGVLLDAGAPSDAGPPLDAGPTPDAGSSAPSDAGLSDAGMPKPPLTDDASSSPVARYGCRGSSIASANAPSTRGPFALALAASALVAQRRRRRAR